MVGRRATQEPPDRAALVAERVALLTRLAELDRLLGPGRRGRRETAVFTPPERA